MFNYQKIFNIAGQSKELYKKIEKKIIKINV